MTPVNWGHGDETPAHSGTERMGNHIYLYGVVAQESSVALLKLLQEVVDEHLLRPGLPGEYAPIWLHINSEGGSLFSAFAIADTITRLKVPVYSLSEGVCASAATIIALSCHKRFITENSFFLIHQLSGAAWGTYQQMTDNMKLYEMSMKRLVRFYMAHSILSEQQAHDMLSRDSWFDAGQCVDLGLVDSIL